MAARRIVNKRPGSLQALKAANSVGPGFVKSPSATSSKITDALKTVEDVLGKFTTMHEDDATNIAAEMNKTLSESGFATTADHQTHINTLIAEATGVSESGAKGKAEAPKETGGIVLKVAAPGKMRAVLTPEKTSKADKPGEKTRRYTMKLTEDTTIGTTVFPKGTEIKLEKESRPEGKMKFPKGQSLAQFVTAISDKVTAPVFRITVPKGAAAAA